ncbi:hypothetical protein VTN00DRAFT_6377 [Thermoascus crustaceus]|uniref:uncharacterized protein n=1 Tax=Thermoascus crustaceus TaxID=5088 RepID=UPI003742C6CF
MLPENRPLQLSLLQFLRQARNLHAQHVAGTSSSAPIYVLGNPSADLDSIISAIIYSYFASGSSRIPIQQQQQQQQQQGARQYIPLINLHDVPSGSELRRLRPEFATALWLSTNPAVPSNDGDVAGWANDAHSAANVLRDHALTVADVKAHLRRQNTTNWSFETIMVDWNALPVRSKERPGRGSLDTLPGVEIDVVGCIDHHVDEAFVPPAPVQDHPRLIQPGPGSCTSLVVRELRSRGLWPEETTTASTSTHEDETGRAAIYEAQAAKLALAAILIDTTNLTAEGKVTEVDRTAVAFLEAKVQRGYETQQRSLLKHRHPQPHRQQQPPVPTPGGDPSLEWNRANFFSTIQRTKHESLDFLTLDEILGRDYKDWTEAPASTGEDTGKTLRVGICSVVQPVSYLVAKAGGVTASGASSGAKAREFLTDLRNFSRDRELDVVAVMTAFTSPSSGDGEGQFQRELFVWAVNDTDSTAASGTKRFADRAVRELGLEEWDGDGGAPESVDIRAELNGEKGGWKRVWRQTDVTKSRKQVAPLLRAAIAE